MTIELALFAAGASGLDISILYRIVVSALTSAGANDNTTDATVRNDLIVVRRSSTYYV